VIHVLSALTLLVMKREGHRPVSIVRQQQQSQRFLVLIFCDVRPGPEQLQKPNPVRYRLIAVMKMRWFHIVFYGTM